MQLDVNTFTSPDHRTVADNQRASGCQHRGHRRPFRLTGHTRGAPAYCSCLVSANEYYTAAPSFLRVVGGVSSGSAFPPLWSLRFFASRVYGRGGPAGSHPASSAEKRRLDITLRAELVVCVALEIAAEREANQGTQVLPVELIILLLEYNRGDEILTHRYPFSIRAIAERLMKARSVDPKHHVTERPLHVRSLLYYVPDAELDAESPVLAAPPPVRESAIPRRPSFADPCPPIRATVVDGGIRAPAFPRRPPPALLLQSFAPPRSPSFTVPSLLLMLAFRPQLGFLHLPCLLEGRRDLGRPFGRCSRCLTWSPPPWTWRNSGAHILTCAPILTALVTSARRGCAGC